ncbi:muts domain V-domain-containing protein [Immersiella caudata]|uniref:DNA mismatch repair protein n=1 Tax=Immersiella caudata TaxID=314043 RepID=A0AA39WE31_9PEZI|nr:muts domain V-domain-containing protein [Immersiella caudata]
MATKSRSTAARTPAKDVARRPRSAAPDSTGKQQQSILGFFSKTAVGVAASGRSPLAVSAPRHGLINADALEKAQITVPTIASSPAPTKHAPRCPRPLHNCDNHHNDRDDDNDGNEAGDDECGDGCEIDSKKAGEGDSSSISSISSSSCMPSGSVSHALMEEGGGNKERNGEKEGKRKRRQSEDHHSPRKRSTLASPSDDCSSDGQEVNGGDSFDFMRRWGYRPNDARTARPAPPPQRRQVAPRRRTLPSKADKEVAGGKSAWLAHVMDMEKRTPDHPEYDKSTLFIPPHVWNGFTPFEKQYWAVKQKYWDTVVFFRKGKFYELLEKDAMLGHQLFDLRITERIRMPMVGFPVSAFDTWASQFLSKGFKVARVDEMESALGMEMRVREDSNKKKKTRKEEKIIRRELGCVLTNGTLVDEAMLHDDMATFCAAIKESTGDDGQPAFGIAFVDTATAQFYLAQLPDDADLTKFETFAVQSSPRELILERTSKLSSSGMSTKALRILRNHATPMTIWNHLKPGPDGFWDGDTTRWELEAGGYFSTAWPEALSAVRDNDLVMSAFGALVHYLRTLKLERSLLSRGTFQPYSPVQRSGSSTLVLDGQTLINLEVFANSVDGGSEGTIFRLMNRCITPSGKRLFRQWVCHPLGDAHRINERLDAVDLLLGTTDSSRDLREQFISGMAKLPDLERLVSRIHAGSCKPNDFVRVLEGFEQIEHTMASMKHILHGGSNDGDDSNYGMIGRLLTSVPDLSEPLGFWKGAFDRDKATEEGLFWPSRGVDDDFDSRVDAINHVKIELQALLMRQKRELKNRSIKFADINKEPYQLEVPKTVKVPKDWRQISATASVKRYYFKELDALIRALQEAEEIHSQATHGLTSRFYQRFRADSEAWLQSIHVVAQLDCLASLASFSSSLAEPRCRPVFVPDPDERSVVEFKELRYPCVDVDDFIPNDIKLGGDEANINLLTGANAAGKSTILRMTCTAVIMAQLGCYVPAASARLTPVDRIMSRLGANDNIFAGQSTFFIELSETKRILAEATPRTLVILDELGRGTSSYDGLAVAEAVLHHIASSIGCIGFFATHYRSLATAEFARHPEVRPRRMQVLVDDVLRRVTFLYKLEDGVAESSFGMHCAAMCGIPTGVVERAEVAAREWERRGQLKAGGDVEEPADPTEAACSIPLGFLSDVSNMLRDEGDADAVTGHCVNTLLRAIETL